MLPRAGSKTLRFAWSIIIREGLRHSRSTIGVNALAHGAPGKYWLLARTRSGHAREDRGSCALDFAVHREPAPARALLRAARGGMTRARVFASKERPRVSRGTTPCRRDGCEDRDQRDQRDTRDGHDGARKKPRAHGQREERSVHLFPRSFQALRLAPAARAYTPNAHEERPPEEARQARQAHHACQAREARRAYEEAGKPQ